MIFFKLIKKFIRVPDEVNYLYNQLSLPEPLTDNEERVYIERWIQGDIGARNYLIEHNMRLVVFIAKRFESPKVLLEDLI